MMTSPTTSTTADLSASPHFPAQHSTQACSPPPVHAAKSSDTASPPGSRKHRTPRNVAKKLFEQAILSSSSASRSRKRSQSADIPGMPVVADRVIGAGISGIPSHAAAARNYATSNNDSAPAYRPTARRRSSTVGGVPRTTPAPVSMLYEKPQASTSGGAITMTIQLAEPMLFLQGLDHNEYSNRTPAMLRGSLIVRVSKPTKIKAVSLTFRGKGRTEWPEGIPPKKSEYFEEKEIMHHTWPFFDHRFKTAELSHCADSFYPRRLPLSGSESSTKRVGSTISQLARSASPIGFSRENPADHRLSLQMVRSRSFSKGECCNGQVPVAQKGYRIFQPGDYVYNFELPVESCLPESIDVDLGSVKYELEGVIERPGAFRPNLTGKREVELVRVPSEANLEASEPIAISRTWEDQLHYDIVISGKSFPLGGTIPIAFKLTPLAKVRCHRIKIFITENIEYSCKNKRVHRIDPVRKIQLFEKRAEAPATSAFAGSSARIVSGGGFSPRDLEGRDPSAADIVNGTDNLLGDLHGSPNIGPTEMEFNVQLPGCRAKEKDRIHFDTTHPSIQVHHWIKIVMRLSKQDPNDPSKRRHFEISIDSPFHILSCKATHANTTLPAYNPTLSPPCSTPLGSCTCPLPSSRRPSPANAARNSQSSNSSNSSSNTLTPTATPNNSSTPTTSTRSLPTLSNQLQPRPHSHFFANSEAPPPSFWADTSPPLITPPPKYESVVGEQGLADYFQRLADESVGDEDSDGVEGEDEEAVRRGRRLTLPPLTPGGRVARSMDERRTWETVVN